MAGRMRVEFKVLLESLQRVYIFTQEAYQRTIKYLFLKVVASSSLSTTLAEHSATSRILFPQFPFPVFLSGSIHFLPVKTRISKATLSVSNSISRSCRENEKERRHCGNCKRAALLSPLRHTPRITRDFAFFLFRHSLLPRPCLVSAGYFIQKQINKTFQRTETYLQLPPRARVLYMYIPVERLRKGVIAKIGAEM
jgi:hypothetical protein